MICELLCPFTLAEVIEFSGVDPNSFYLSLFTYTTSSLSLSLRDITERRDPAGREKNEALSVVPHFCLSPPRLAFLAWGDFHTGSRFVRSTIPKGKRGTTRSLVSTKS